MSSRTLLFLSGIAAVMLLTAIFYLQSGAVPTGAATTSTPNAGAAALFGSSATPESARTNPVATGSGSNWKEEIERLTTEGASDAETVHALAALLPSLPPDGQSSAAKKIVKLTANKDIAVLLAILQDPRLSDEARKMLMESLIARDEDVRLPALVEIAEIPHHPDHDEAVAALQNVLGYDAGQNGENWEASLQKYFKLKAAKSREDALKLNLMQAQKN